MTFPTHKNSNDISIEAVYLIRLFICHYVQKNFTDVIPHPIQILKMNQLAEPLNFKQINLTASIGNE